MEASVSLPPGTVVQCKNKRNRGKRKSRKRRGNESRKRGRCGGVKRRERWLRVLRERLSAQKDASAPLSAPRPIDPPIVDLTQSEEEIDECWLNPSSFEVLDTDVCVKVRFSNEVPVEVLKAHLHHYHSGEGGVSPVVRSWRIEMFLQTCPGAPYPDFNFI